MTSIPRMSLLGELTVTSDGSEIALPASRKTRALFGYLAAMGRAIRRERHCELFWDLPDDPPASLRRALNINSTSRLRKWSRTNPSGICAHVSP